MSEKEEKKEEKKEILKYQKLIEISSILTETDVFSLPQDLFSFCFLLSTLLVFQFLCLLFYQPKEQYSCRR